MTSNMAAEFAQSEEQAIELFKAMQEDYRFAGMAKIREAVPGGASEQWYIIGATDPLQLRVRVDEPTPAQIDAAIEYLADYHHLYLWRVNEADGEGEDRQTIKGWSFVKRGSSGPLQGATIADAVIFNLEKIKDDNTRELHKIRQQYDNRSVIDQTIGHHLDVLAPGVKEEGE